MFQVVNQVVNRIALKLDGYNSFEEYWKHRSSGQSFRDSRDIVIFGIIILGCILVVVVALFFMVSE